ncbi:MAG: hypothetical protein DMF53_24940 [Acidobacteria bacterium]|nr:MAG: hypothetical protein DMF53_24940 [Acidobacteriota bacterium]
MTDDLLLPQPGLPLTTWQVTFGSQAPDPKNVQVSFRFREEGSYSMAFGQTDPLLPCRLENDLSGLSRKVGPRASEIRLEAYSFPSPVDLTLWRRRDVLVFVWPREGPVVLRTGSDAGAPQYDLEALASDLLARPSRAAILGPQEPEIPLFRFLALLAGAGIALVLLGKALPGT